MPEKEDILVRIGDKTYRLDSDDPAALKKIPWPQRKRLIEVLEAMKAAEYVDSSRRQKSETLQDQARQSRQALKRVKDIDSTTSQTATSLNSNTQDSDILMQRFLAEQKSYQHNIPDKRSIYKWFLIIFSLILLLVLIF
ncbi:hypothetical protein GCM10011365_12490 [Marinicella pacifica]|uniref:Uncharacterized protein n=1 Tax=Marinicella pacifica TaxID=1171543 RepID=A0A917CPD2_9GAMM|nr:hypothetical protein [Marinicella pacifica]GGF92739.1 hypothetical protein GCM10011365_12490 [Marinicella pacifica]